MEHGAFCGRYERGVKGGKAPLTMTHVTGKCCVRDGFTDMPLLLHHHPLPRCHHCQGGYIQTDLIGLQPELCFPDFDMLIRNKHGILFPPCPDTNKECLFSFKSFSYIQSLPRNRIWIGKVVGKVVFFPLLRFFFTVCQQSLKCWHKTTRQDIENPYGLALTHFTGDNQKP